MINVAFVMILAIIGTISQAREVRNLREEVKLMKQLMERTNRSDQTVPPVRKSNLEGRISMVERRMNEMNRIIEEFSTYVKKNSCLVRRVIAIERGLKSISS